MDNRAIGVFDSGLGGLTAVRELMKVLPNEKVLYFGDTGRVPYGTRSAETIAKYASQDMNFLIKQNVKVILAACGTVSSNAKHVLENLSVPYTAIIDPCCKAAIDSTKNGKIGVIATSATINSHAFSKTLKNTIPSFEVYETSCPLLVPLVENGFIDENNEISELALKNYLLPLKEKGIDTLILGCTHYPILEKLISKVIGDEVILINSGKEIAKECVNILKTHDMFSNLNNTENEYFVSDSVQNFNSIAEICLGEKIKGNITKIDIENF